MTPGEDYLEINRANWDGRAPAHAASEDYGVERFVADPAHLSSVVRFDLPLLGDVSGLDAVHLQCHIGTDSLSLARLGARVTGLDLSPASIAAARDLAERAGPPVDYVVADLYSATDALADRRFDLVYTGIGAICWLPDIARWARVVADLLRPGGRLFLREGHPMMWAIDESRPDALTVGYPYFETTDPIDEEYPGTYVDTDVEFEHNRSMSWNHGFGETVNTLLDSGLVISGLTEHRSVPWDALPGRMVRGADDEWRLTAHPERLPLSYTLRAVKPPG